MMRSAALAALAGILGALAFPDPGFWPLSFVAWVPLLLALERATVGRGAQLGFIAGLAFFAVALRWLVPLTPVGTAVLVVCLASFVALFGAVAATLRAGARGVLAIPLAWAGIEWLRSWMFTGFGWGAAGYALAARPRLIQAAALGGVPLLSIAVMASNAALATALSDRTVNRRAWGVALAIAALSPVALAAYGEWALRAAPVSSDGLRVVAVGGDIDPYAKWSGQGPMLSLERYVERTEPTVAARPDLVVWPETAIPQPIQNERIAVIGPWLQARARQWKTSLLVGAPELANERIGTYWNGAVLLRPDGTSGPGYRKQHLVPFGEYVPFASVAAFVPRVVPGFDYVAGPGGGPFPVGAARVGVLICFEDVFPDEAVTRARDADLLASMSNDAWFGAAGAKQHLQVSVLRAVETGRSIVRAANGGISALIDPQGRVQPEAPGGVALGSLPVAARTTLFARAPDAVPLFALSVTVVALAVPRLRRRTGAGSAHDAYGNRVGSAL